MADSSFTINNSRIAPPTDLDEISDPLLESTAELERCAHALDLEDWILLGLKQFEQETTLHTIFPSEGCAKAGGRPAHTADEKPTPLIQPLTALWVRHSTVRGAPIVPLSISGSAYLNSVRAKAMRTTWAAALYGLDTGGGAAAIILDPNAYGENGLREAVKRIGQVMAPFCAPHLSQSADVGLSPTIIPDGLNSIEMEWLNAAFRLSGNTYTRIAGRLYGPPFLPESDDVGSVENATAFCLMELIRCATGHLRETRVAIQGFDPVCQNLAHRLHRFGARIVAVADVSGALRDPLGMDPTALIAYTRENELLVGYRPAEAMVNADLLESDCDVLVLASSVRQIAPHNAARVRARSILEVTPHAITPAAKTELSAAGRTIVSDLVCGGLRLLYYGTESQRAIFATRPQPWLRRRIRHTWSEIESAGTKWRVPLHQAAEMLAVDRVSEVLRARGV
ncbi:MAG: Glu/Leu/Phe/Val dehydrogenase dimerization domain-containing protein [Terriglobia bacterium]|nr:Glu/Leu/Phe/Val dehydrogenase dimerization domain-containing protein [Terriglobia bacterium]